MRIGIPLETKSGESRVAATPETVKKLITAGHSLIIQSHAGVKASIIDEAFTAAGATIG
jgi:NAD(P) transhydrogenase subunit alpha